MSLKQIVQKIKQFLLRRDVYAVLIVLFVGVSAFGLGRLSSETKDRQPITIQEAFSDITIATSSDDGVGELVVPEQEGMFVGSKNSDKYHYPWCPGAQRIKDANKVWFSSVADAENAGYVSAANCEGL